MYNLKKLSTEKFKQLLKLVNESTPMTENELNTLNQNSVGLVDYSYKGKGPMKISFISPSKNGNLTKFLEEILTISETEIVSIHLNEYRESSKTLPHRDSQSSRTYLILLSNSSDGGELTLEGFVVPFNQVGQIIDYDGGTIMHGVREIKKGFRKTLVVWTHKKSMF